AELPPAPGDDPLPGREAGVPGAVPGVAGAHLRHRDGRGELHRLPALRVHLPAAGHRGRDAEGREAELRQDLHARAVRLRVLRAVRAGVSDRRHHHAQDLRSRDERPARDAARQGPVALAGLRVPALVGHRQQAARHAGATEGGPRREQGRQGVTLETLVFGLVALALLGGSLGVVLTPNLFHAVLSLAGALVATAVIFLLLDAAFLFAVQLLLYAGGVVTVLVFAIMLTERLIGEHITQTNRHVVNGAVMAVAAFVGVAGF